MKVKIETYYIVSEDKGLAILTGYWAERGENVKTASDIAAAKEDLEEEKAFKNRKKMKRKEKPGNPEKSRKNDGKGNPVKREKNLISGRNSMEKKSAEGKCTSCAGNKTAGTHKKTGNKITESGAAETGCGKHRDSGGRKGADRRETGTAGKRSCSPSGE